LFSQLLAVSIAAKILYSLLLVFVFFVLAFRVVLARLLAVALLALLVWPFRALRRPRSEGRATVDKAEHDLERLHDR
jgi:hypothetical protein